MQLDFQRVTYDGDLEEADREALIDLVEQFEDAQDANAAEFNSAKEQVEELEGTVSEFEDAKDELITEVVSADAFSEVPLTEEQLEDADFEQVREWRAFVSETDASDEETDDNEEDAEFEDMGQQGPVNEGGDEDEGAEFARELVDGLSGVNAQ